MEKLPRYTTKGLVKTAKFIQNRLKGMNKKESLKEAGYALNVQNKAFQVEKTQNYAILTEQILNKNTQLLMKLLKETGEADDVEIQNKKSLITLRMAQIQKILTPSVRVRENVDTKGNKKRTIWMQGLKSGNDLTETSNNGPESASNDTQTDTSQ